MRGSELDSEIRYAPCGAADEPLMNSAELPWPDRKPSFARAPGLGVAGYRRCQVQVGCSHVARVAVHLAPIDDRRYRSRRKPGHGPLEGSDHVASRHTE